MNDYLHYYKEHQAKYTEAAQRLSKKMALFSFYRILVFVITVFCVYLTFQNLQLAFGLALTGGIIFFFILSKHTDIRKAYEFYKALITINEDEIKIDSGDFLNRPDGLQFQDDHHLYCADIDLFGRGSFFQYVNRTIIPEGTLSFADNLKSNDISNIELRQKAILDLSSKTEWRQFYTAKSKLFEVTTPAKQIISWLVNYKVFLPPVMRWVPTVFSIATIIFIGLSVFKMISLNILIYWVMFGLGVTGIYLKKIQRLSENIDKVKNTIKQYAELLKLIENETFSSELLQEKQLQIQSNHQKASAIFNEFSRFLDAFDNRNNLIGLIFGNGYFLTDLRNSYKIETWISKHANKVADWFEVVSFFDAYNTLGTFVFNHPDFVFPKIIKNDDVISATNLGHPMLHPKKRVGSDVTIKKDQFFIVTGANMAGKSTFLRTVSMHIVMANLGLPVCATASNYSPIKLITSMRTADSLTDDSSYFFSELSRLKMIVEAIKKDVYFIVLDEILKGTNSQDKAIGSKKFVEKLVAAQATGIIATHDLSLCTIEKELDAVKNYYFDTEIIANELHFDYKLKVGICKNMNASFLLKKMDIV